jgi:flagellar assembly protein FliH
MEEALVTMRDSRDIRIVVNPDDFELAGRYLQKLSKTMPQAGSAEVLPDPEVSRGGCIVRSSYGQIDQQLETQLERLVEQLKN